MTKTEDKISTNQAEIVSEFFHNEIRPEKILHLGTMCYDMERGPDAVRDELDDDPDQIFEALGLKEKNAGDEVTCRTEFIRSAIAQPVE